MIKKTLFTITFSILFLVAKTQNNIDYSNPITYEIGGITLNGANNLNNNTILNITELSVGEKIQIPGEKVTNAKTKLWKQNLFSDIDISVEKIIDNTVFLNVNVVEYPRLSKFKFIGKKVSKSDISSLKEELKLIRGKILSENLLNNSINVIKNYYTNKGFYNIQVGYITSNDPKTKNSKDLTFSINKGKKTKIKEIKIYGRKKIANNKSYFNTKDSIYSISNNRIRKSMKETKKKNPWRFWKTSKFILENYENDKLNLIAEYNKNGYRDAKIKHDTVIINNANNISIKITLQEGETYQFGDISFAGNTIYSTEQLKNQLGIKKGDIFDQSILDSRISGGFDGGDISSLYLDDGYLFFNATPVETSINNNQIDFEVRIYEGEQARINKVLLRGNSKTNDHVIMRELRTRPGNLFKRSEIIRSQRELAQMQYFDPEKFDVKVDPDPKRNEVDITYIVEEKSSDQIQLQGGWGAGRIVGQLGLTFNNFSTKNVFKLDKWTPLPSGDGQRLSLSASSNGIYYQNYRISFTEPWLGGKKPNSLTISLSKSIS